MALISRKALFETISPFIQIKRFRGKINLRRPRAPHYERARYIELAKPIFPKKEVRILPELCKKNVNYWVRDEGENPFQRIIANELRHMLETSRLVAFYHLNCFKEDQKFKATTMFKKSNMIFKNYGKKTLQMAVEGTPYEAVDQFYVSHNMMVFSPEPDIKKLLQISKKFPQIILLAGILEGKFVSKDELVMYSAIPNLQAAQSHLVQTLSSIGGQVVSQLTSHQNVLVSQLQERIKQLEDKS